MSVWQFDDHAPIRDGSHLPLATLARVEPDPVTQQEPQVAAPAKPRHRFLRRSLDIAGAVCLILAFLVLVDFARFVDAVLERPARALHPAQGIIALTGGAERLNEGFDLLQLGLGQRLLVTGVNKATSDAAVASGKPLSADKLACCVDFDRNALNTVGNAMEAARWVREHRYTSVILVTSNYHMPRSLLELRRSLPRRITVTAYPVAGRDFSPDGWWRNPWSARLMVSEYVKWVGARIKLRLQPPTAEIAGAQDTEAPAHAAAH